MAISEFAALAAAKQLEQEIRDLAIDLVPCMKLDKDLGIKSDSEYVLYWNGWPEVVREKRIELITDPLELHYFEHLIGPGSTKSFSLKATDFFDKHRFNEILDQATASLAENLDKFAPKFRVVLSHTALSNAEKLHDLCTGRPLADAISCWGLGFEVTNSQGACMDLSLLDPETDLGDILAPEVLRRLAAAAETNPGP